LNAPRKIAFFLTGHGFGHAVRESALMEALPPGVEIDVYTSIPGDFFRDEVHRPVRVIPCEIDCGCLQSDTIHVDVEGTLARYAEIESSRADHISVYSSLLKASGAELVIGDTPPLAFPIAKAAGIPSLCLCNFTWLDIYAEYVRAHPRYAPLFERMRADYALADRHLRLFPAMTGHATGPEEDVGLVCRPGSPSRSGFARRFGLDPERKWCLIYVGSFGLEGVDWSGLARYPDWEFMGLYPLQGAPSNYRFLKKDLSFRYADLNASCDLVLGKLGYGLVAECLAQAKPVLFLGRKDFAEFDLLKALVQDNGLGREIPLDRFKRADFGSDLAELTAQPREPMAATGVSDILRKLGYPA
jgi:hypothetical protein